MTAHAAMGPQDKNVLQFKRAVGYVDVATAAPESNNKAAYLAGRCLHFFPARMAERER